ncbi:MAG: NAD(P)/FAD-dependent oxidoreductase [Clostridia bacterium]|nr:NAD(P)/FAD-dependent oxidoreductase [Clostridia bacterium]
MGKKIIVAGGGHGGIAAGAILSRNGYDVTVYEKNKREDMGYDWTDIFDRKGLFAVGMDMPAEDKYKLKNDMTFYSPSMKTPLRQHVPEDQLEIQMERKDIYNHIISYAETCGVKFEYENAVLQPVMLGNRVAGVKTEKDGVVYADMVIDAAGLNSPVRRNLPANLGVQNNISEYEQFYVYRAFYNKAAEETSDDKFKVCLFHQNYMGIYWVASEEEHTDVLIGRFTPIDMNDVNEALEYLRSFNPSLGTELVRGGQFVNISVRQPLGVMVADGYAAIGDSAFMPVPIIGSGIANCLKAAEILAYTIINDKTNSYSAEVLWKYQRGFYKKLGNGLAPLACVKLMLTRLESEDIDYIFDSGILTADDMTIGADDTSLASLFSGIKPDDIKQKLTGVYKNPIVMKKVLRMIKELGAATAVVSAMPKIYNNKAVLVWVKQYNNCFKR